MIERFTGCINRKKKNKPNLCSQRDKLMENIQNMRIQIRREQQSLESSTVLLDLFMMLKNK